MFFEFILIKILPITPQGETGKLISCGEEIFMNLHFYKRFKPTIQRFNGPRTRSIKDTNEKPILIIKWNFMGKKNVLTTVALLILACGCFIEERSSYSKRNGFVRDFKQKKNMEGRS